MWANCFPTVSRASISVGLRGGITFPNVANVDKVLGRKLKYRQFQPSADLSLKGMLSKIIEARSDTLEHCSFEINT